MKTLIRNANVVFPNECRRASVLIEGDRIAAINPAPQTGVDQTIDGRGRYLLPGAIDDQVHFREPGLTDKEDFLHATRACAKGGVTTFFDMPNTRPATTTIGALDEKLALASRSCLVNYGFLIGATPHNVEQLARAQRTPGIKVFIGSSTGDLLVDRQEDLERIFAETTLPIAAHCEDEATIQANLQRFTNTSDVADHSRIRNVEVAVTATRRAVDLAIRHHHRLHVFHVSTGAEVPILADHHDVVTAEVCPHHLFFNTDDYERLGTLVQMNPSLKSPSDNAQLWRALLDGNIQVIATDHAPHTRAEKMRPYPDSPSGVPAVENSLALLLDQVASGRCTLTQVTHWISAAPARVWDVLNKGRIAEGFDADLVLVDMEKTAVVDNASQQTKCGWSPWHGTTLTGWPVRTWVMGHEVFRDGEFDMTRRGREAQYDHSLGGYWRTSDVDQP